MCNLFQKGAHMKKTNKDKIFVNEICKSKCFICNYSLCALINEDGK